MWTESSAVKQGNNGKAKRRRNEEIDVNRRFGGGEQELQSKASNETIKMQMKGI